ncbi:MULTISPECIES: RipA family octameric membrane protein [Curtobacterium]|uniref:RipA family octameric membrane protein n=1 Tax=Curtobacterium TaxID=2034 RepID=UPI00188A281E|nr:MULTISPECIES: hypothetical protein [Curtobacterium]MBF4603251.1 hypothetical protein [Curtobacterium sp. VKM Ac-2884]MBT1583511.1 hypothetical protein [Curtobacterium flaccumfaciens pv. flaccumfaciens]MCX2798074.1 hypothetical protein [Curtobacterium flaccumfaciens pv. flaccumfaciens]
MPSRRRTAAAPTDVLELYKLTVEMADRISARRGQANQFYLALQSTLLGVPAIFSLLGRDEFDPLRATLLVAIGALTSITWWLQLRSYRDLNRAKFSVINRIERDHLPVQPFSDEWSSLKRDPLPKWQGRYAELGTVERLVPLAFLVLEVLVGVTVWL